ncbi:MAG: cytochrome c [Deltaproteobacteria bacterium]|nr:cytochrome c [Deltaproteobacteria bacterium]
MRRAIVTLALVLAGCGEATERDPSQWPISRVEIERAIPTDDPGERTYRAHCIACHGVDGRGAGGATGANFTSPEGPLTRPDDVLLVSIIEGRRGEIGVMPAHRDVLGEERSREVLGFLRARFGADVAIAPLDDAAVDDAGPSDDAAIDAGVIDDTGPSDHAHPSEAVDPGVISPTADFIENPGFPVERR